MRKKSSVNSQRALAAGARPITARPPHARAAATVSRDNDMTSSYSFFRGPIGSTWNMYWRSLVIIVTTDGVTLSLCRHTPSPTPPCIPFARVACIPHISLLLCPAAGAARAAAVGGAGAAWRARGGRRRKRAGGSRRRKSRGPAPAARPTHSRVTSRDFA
ncbi:hypothetical protein EVAR_32169_1 [Eumeta japonica]|uniref:Uncharacterized protein n=1 Tax=Eumeta variegata TaxID=151549 RepID=A0A4C1VXT8_EUMVA|nr:hypothetical protein EVAR_32169_1 [Eumeta japonica]